MQQGFSRRVRQILALMVLGVLATGPALAQGRGHDDRDRNEQGHAQKLQQRGHDDRDRGKNERREHARFNDHQREMARNYYEGEMKRGHCPPGLAKKRNGCEPPGHARRYEIGRPLPRDVIYYDVPQPIVVQLGPPPRGYRYARVSNDILLLAVGTGIVVDALQDLGRR